MLLKYYLNQASLEYSVFNYIVTTVPLKSLQLPYSQDLLLTIIYMVHSGHISFTRIYTG